MPAFTDIPEGMAATPANFNSRFQELVDSAGFLGDTANANSTAGLTINQGAADDEALSLKSSDIAHALTGLTETDTYFSISKSYANNGGTYVKTVCEDVNAQQLLFFFAAGGQAGTSLGMVDFLIREHDGAGSYTNVTADGLLMTIRARVGGSDQVCWSLDEDGDSVQTGGATLGGVNGIDVNPGSDTNADLITVGVTGAPKFYWVEASDLFAVTKGFSVAGAFEAIGGNINLNGADVAGLTHLIGGSGSAIGFYGATPTGLQTGVAVSAAAIHAALVNLGLITA